MKSELRRSETDRGTGGDPLGAVTACESGMLWSQTNDMTCLGNAFILFSRKVNQYGYLKYFVMPVCVFD